MSPLHTTRPLYFWNFGSNSEILRWQMSINDAKCTVAPDALASSITCFLLLTFCQVPRRNFLQFFPFLVHRCFCSRNFHNLRHTSFWVVSDFRQLPCGYFSNFFHSLSAAAFASGIFIALGRGINWCRRLKMVQWVDSFPCNVIFMIFM